jgi:hypothetical protein
MYTNGVSVLFPAIPGETPHFGNENGRGSYARGRSLRCSIFLIAAEQVGAFPLKLQTTQFRYRFVVVPEPNRSAAYAEKSSKLGISLDVESGLH